ncbi:MAG: hypothetical protein A2992_09665 [Elusimicrobia bacterium RIFCSPLOWO2_01_FULL_59_12]|nr:MAG: hypothetical protein A2992_09665 [Elusimicrobia bacterium RIFCSPLOWO2_01_FULL_59_12]
MKEPYLKTRRVVLSVVWLAAACPSLWALSVSPGRTEVRLAPGASQRGALTTTNDSPDRQHVTLSTKDWFVLEANRAKKLTVNTWLKLHGAKEFDLNPGESREVQFTVKCPKDARGELVGMVSFMHTPDQPSMMTPMISVSVYLEAAGTEQRAGEIERLAVRKWNNQIQAAVGVKSTGNVHLRPTGTIALEDSTRKEVARFPVKEGGPAYPGQGKGYFAKVPADFQLTPGRYTARADLSYRELSLKAEDGFNVTKDGQIEMDSK